MNAEMMKKLAALNELANREKTREHSQPQVGADTVRGAYGIEIKQLPGCDAELYF